MRGWGNHQRKVIMEVQVTAKVMVGTTVDGQNLAAFLNDKMHLRKTMQQTSVLHIGSFLSLFTMLRLQTKSQYSKNLIFSPLSAPRHLDPDIASDRGVVNPRRHGAGRSKWGLVNPLVEIIHCSKVNQ